MDIALSCAGQSSASSQENLVSDFVHLESHELFSQLCTTTNLVRLGPRRGVFTSFVNVADGVIRIFRDWLAKSAAITQNSTTIMPFDLTNNKKQAILGTLLLDPDVAARIAWVNSQKRDVGLLMHVRPVKVVCSNAESAAVSYAGHVPIAYAKNVAASHAEDVSYKLEYEGE
jgi:hypothetical protein